MLQMSDLGNPSCLLAASCFWPAAGMRKVTAAKRCYKHTIAS